MTSISPVESSSPISHRSTRPKSPLRTKNQQEDTLTRTAVTTKTATWADFDPGESGVGDDIDGCDEEVITSDLEDLDEVEITFLYNQVVNLYLFSSTSLII